MRNILLILLLLGFSGFSQDSTPNHELGLEIHGGTFGLFNVNDVFTKAEHTIGASIYGDFEVHPNFSIGAEQMFMFGKPKNPDQIRSILNTNARFKLKFQTFEKIHFNILVAGGFSLWPANNSPAFLTPTLNETRLGWDFRASAVSDFKISKKFSITASFGYLASSSTSDDIVWITHDSMLISIGPKIIF